MTAALTVHPAAAVWPLLPDDELRALADDIAANGLRQPITVTPDGVLLDGRNRLAACQLAGVSPGDPVVFDGDPVAYVLSANDRRRHMTKGARAMAGWTALLEVQAPQRDKAALIGVSASDAGQAAMVAQWCPEQAEEVIAGRTPMSTAYREAQERKAAADSHDARVARLTNDAPDLAQLVIDERMTLTEAEAAFRRREKDLADQRAGARSLLSKLLVLADPGDTDPGEWAAGWAGRFHGTATVDDVAAVKRAAALLTALHRELRKAVTR